MHAFIVHALASYRITRLVTRDTLTETPREAVQRWALNRRHERKPAWKLDDLVECPFCAGWWVTLLVRALDRHPIGRWLVRAFAVAGLQALASSFDMTLSSARAVLDRTAKRGGAQPATPPPSPSRPDGVYGSAGGR